nr:ribonuclease domain-containing protein [Psychromicrobium silvestre]
MIALALIIGGTLLFNRITASDSSAAGNSHSNQSATSAKKSTKSPTSGAGTSSVSNPSKLQTIKASQLPKEGQQTLTLINQGGPYPYDRDGVNFGNFEGVLPKQRSGYYKEYTVKTPGESDRGARRIIVGAQGEKYYTDDHYVSFRFILEGQ